MIIRGYKTTIAYCINFPLYEMLYGVTCKRYIKYRLKPRC